MRYNRILVKLSGGAIAGDKAWGFDPKSLNHIADEVLSLHKMGVQVSVVVGGGNIFRGELGEEWGIERAEADNIGMMATVTNSLMLRGVLKARGDTDVRVMTAIPMNTVAEPFIRLRAIRHLENGYIVVLAAGTGNPYVTTDYPSAQRALELQADALLAAKNGTDGIYTSDPRQDPAARRYRMIQYNSVIQQNLQALDQSAVLLARDHHLPIHVFDFDTVGVMCQICRGEDVGTLISDSGDVLV
ncbi:MAG: UMP kinase [Chloroflexi bacterium AL-W]|nr:UMP kinase [Chloroflexi bacterium AL-N1]NOK68403.1 UMP kinase [Chloroflexi bacterium AL-N10]NOK74049.1 UMP kinase [Chloroflexi bacterium AL-N5]NOK83017.1 UMP kinase [Chloroflexi bacterium AL-W]NOK90539.1 UMP kinase [Chloroflexi bacterium AL-N15]